MLAIRLKKMCILEFLAQIFKLGHDKNSVSTNVRLQPSIYLAKARKRLAIINRLVVPNKEENGQLYVTLRFRDCCTVWYFCVQVYTAVYTSMAYDCIQVCFTIPQYAALSQLFSFLEVLFQQVVSKSDIFCVFYFKQVHSFRPDKTSTIRRNLFDSLL